VVVVKFHGKCQLEYPLPGASDQEVTLASTMVDRGHVMPFSDVQCDQVRKALPYATTPDRQKAFGLALGRVLAHELYHFLADKTRHAAAGLASASHDWLELVTGTASKSIYTPIAGCLWSGANTTIEAANIISQSMVVVHSNPCKIAVSNITDENVIPPRQRPA